MPTVSQPTLLPTQPARPQPNRDRIRKKLQTFAFVDLFLDELGWDQLHQPPQAFVVLEQEILLTALAEKRGVIVLHCPELLDSATRRKLEQQVAKRFREHLIIYTNAAQTTQIWQSAKRTPGKPLVVREQRYDRGQSGEAIVQRLVDIAFSIAEEETITHVDSTNRYHSSFDVERVTKRFYDRFKAEHNVFLKFIEGISDTEDARWYASVMLNRLMFVYFIQKKGFLAGDANYLNNKLKQSDDANINFYREFLRPLFFEGLAKPVKDRSPQVNALLGSVPYLNGGIFLLHSLEEQYPPLAIANSAFAKLFAFFDQYQWHLDERPLKNDNEINPDVLGYIFEKYINQKQMGAYYTKEDITEYISQNTVIPFLLDTISKEVRIAFEGEQSVWDLLQSDPDRYIYKAVAHGIYLNGQELVLPPHIAAGIDNVAARGSWNTPTPKEFGLPTEIWRETVARRQRYAELRQQLTRGQVRTANDLITLNLDIRQFAQDVITYTDSTSLIRAAWKALNSITILDPTCGSGAFLFAALNILEPLYEVCLKRMEEFVVGDDEPESASGAKSVPSDFRNILQEIDSHPNRRYAIFKRIIVNNLFGVDIMEEAIEICKLRLFLKLVAQVDDAKRIEPLPDIDFNIRAGNTLVGFTSEDEVKRALNAKQIGRNDIVQGKMVYGDDQSAFEAIKEKGETIARLYRRFREQQTLDPNNVAPADKAELRRRLGTLDEELNQLLARQYGIDPNKSNAYTAWRISHQPFHWYVEFFDVLARGGFDVIIGNPPYVEYSQIKKSYKIYGYSTESCGNLYAFTIERCFDILMSSGRLGMIVQLPIVCTDRMKPLRDECAAKNQKLWFANFDDRPARLFEGLEHIRATVVVSLRGSSSTKQIYSTTYNRWYAEAREELFQQITYSSVSSILQPGTIPKIGDAVSQKIMVRLIKHLQLGKYLDRSNKNAALFHNAPQYWVRSMDYAPYFWNEREGKKVSTQMKSVYLPSQLDAEATVAILNSSLFYWWFIVRSDCRHLNLREIEDFPIDIGQVSRPNKLALQEITERLMKDLQKNANRKVAQYKTTGKVIYDEFRPSLSKPILDEIDIVLAQHYGFTDDELDFITNYDIKYRMGDELGSDDDNEEEA